MLKATRCNRAAAWVIDIEKCIKCDSCSQVCPEGAVVVE
ncbi:MAG: 4Fe-4S binding protein [Bacteroidales bacterium]|nr:4Fe-4S binding protein [Bacteroidales bacterium]MCF8456103.1 4Fe-4S binding protein [Bacteroidales bacterium]